jgi:hypothetical protein
LLDFYVFDNRWCCLGRAPTALVGSVVEAATVITTGQAASVAAVSARVATLTEGVLKTMLLSRLKCIAVITTLIVVPVGAGALALSGQEGAEQPDKVQPAPKAVAAAPDGGEKAMDWQRKADAAEWKWSDHYASLFDSVERQLRGYEVHLVRLPNSGWAGMSSFTVHVLDNGKEVCSFKAHSETPFTQIGDVLYVAKLSPIATGSSIVAYDLKARKRLWECDLRGNPPEDHSKYRHQINLDTDGDAVVVYGKETNGRYIEYVDRRTGRTLGHKKLPPKE